MHILGMSGPESCIREMEKHTGERFKDLFSLKRERSVTTDIDAYLNEAEKEDLRILVKFKTEHGRVGEDLYFKKLWKDSEHFELICRQQAAVPMNSPAIVTTVRDKDKNYGYLMSRVSGKTMFDFLNSPESTPETRLTVKNNLEAAVDKMHGNGFVHGDLWMTNIMVTPDLRVIFIDPLSRVSIRDSGEEYPIDTAQRERIRLKIEVLPYLRPEAKAPVFDQIDGQHATIVYEEMAIAMSHFARKKFLGEKEALRLETKLNLAKR
jgi:hypothetical protein